MDYLEKFEKLGVKIPNILLPKAGTDYSKYAVLACDLLVLATPIYSWFCTPPMKTALDRLVYGMNKI